MSVARGSKPPGVAHLRFAQNLRHLRRVQRLSTTALSELLRAQGHPLHASAITRIEKGERRVDVDDLAALAAVLRVPCQRFLDDREVCGSCGATPPAGFTCNSCGASA